MLSGYILKIKPVAFADGLDVRNKRVVKDGISIFSLKYWKNVAVIK